MTALIGANVVAGPFSALYTPPGGSPTTIGLIGGEGYRMLRSNSGEPITADAYGKETILNGIHTGGSLYLDFKLLEANLAMAKALAYPFGVTTPYYGFEEELGPIGALWSAFAGALKLSPIAGTTAVTETDAAGGVKPYRTFTHVILAPGHNIDLALRAGLKTIPIRLLVLPTDVSGTIKFHTRATS